MNSYNQFDTEPKHNILSDMLEYEPEVFYHFIRAPYGQKLFEEWVGGACQTYHNYYSPALFQLVMLTGKLRTAKKPFFGCYNPDGIPEQLAMNIAKEIFRLKPSPLETNYYDVDLAKLLGDYEDIKTLTYRTGNSNLRKLIREEYQIPEPDRKASISYVGPPIPSPAPSRAEAASDDEEEVPVSPATSLEDYVEDAVESVANDNDNDNNNDNNNDVDSYIWSGRVVAAPPTYDGHIQNYIDNLDEQNRMYEAAYNSN